LGRAGTVWVAIANSSPVTKNTTLALFGPAWLGVLLSTGSAIMVQRLCPEPPRKEEAKGDDDDNKKAPDMTRTQRLVITIILVAGSLDAFGDYGGAHSLAPPAPRGPVLATDRALAAGNKFARNTILTNRYPLAREAVVNYVLMGSNIFSIYVGKVILTRTISRHDALGTGCKRATCASSHLRLRVGSGSWRQPGCGASSATLSRLASSWGY
jgi:hypothetical protein